MHSMFFDTTFNSVKTVMNNFYMTFHNAALRLYHYMRGLTAANQPASKLIIRKFCISFLSFSTNPHVANTEITMDRSVLPYLGRCATSEPRVRR
jgi:hypothetical protein